MFHTIFLLQNNLCEFKTQENKFKKGFCIKKTVLDVFLRFLYTKINLTQIWYDKCTSIAFQTHTTRIFILIFNYIRQIKSESKISIF